MTTTLTTCRKCGSALSERDGPGRRGRTAPAEADVMWQGRPRWSRPCELCHRASISLEEVSQRRLLKTKESSWKTRVIAAPERSPGIELSFRPGSR